MPLLLIAFFVLVGAATAPPLVKGLITPRDPSSRPKLGRPIRDGYWTWTSRPWSATSDDTTRLCDVTFFALTTRRAPARLIAGGVEQPLDTSWTLDRRLREGERRTIAFEFRDPSGGRVLACQEQSVVCHSPHMSDLGAEDTREGRCAPDAAPPKSKAKGLRFVGYRPAATLANPGSGSAHVAVAFEILGPITEDWYCPEIEVTWPDMTRTRRESDCPPWPGEPDQRFHWRFEHEFPSGEWVVTACISKAGRKLACESVTVHVVGG